jgi:hypothetical protein
MEFPRRITTSTYFWHMAQYYESGGKRQFAVTTLRYMCVVFRLGAQVSRELVILYTNLNGAMVADMRPLFFELRTSLITFRIFVRCQRLIARNVADGFLLFSLADTFIRSSKLVGSMT